MSLLPRLLSGPVARALETFPVLSMIGARQTGKSTLVRSLLPPPARTYVTLDDIETLARAREEPDALLRSAGRITLDEVQRSPELLLAVKRVVDDEDRAPGRIVLTGSANLLLLGPTPRSPCISPAKANREGRTWRTSSSATCWRGGARCRIRRTPSTGGPRRGTRWTS